MLEKEKVDFIKIEGKVSSETRKTLVDRFQHNSTSKFLSSLRAGPKGPCAESARAVTGRRCPHSGVGEDFLGHRPGPLTKTGVTRERKVVD